MKIASSPWGRPQSQTVLAPGIIQVSCAGHGGILVSPERFAKMHEAFRLDAGPEGCWYEEDCEVNMVFLAFPEAFRDITIWSAINFIRAYKDYPAATEYLETDAAKPLWERHARFQDVNGDKYVAGCMGSSGHGWDVHFRRIRDGSEAFARGLSTDEAFAPAPVDLTAFGDRVSYATA